MSLCVAISFHIYAKLIFFFRLLIQEVFSFFQAQSPILLIHPMTTPAMLSLGTFAEFCCNDQLTREDMLKPGFVPDITTKIRIDMVEFDDQEIEE